jgi:hypothetical protein
VAKVVVHLPRKCEDLGSNSSIAKKNLLKICLVSGCRDIGQMEITALEFIFWSEKRLKNK